jgi:bifunctional DNA-binding transcriptional regulator/antitoxin component of YhaV-PrlF toxin-antitoxin module
LPSKAIRHTLRGMHVVTITAKRQVTLPAALCKELGLAFGAKAAVERRLVGKQTVWVLKGPRPDWSWVGSLRRYAKRKSHRLSDIRRSIAGGWASGHRA